MPCTTLRVRRKPPPPPPPPPPPETGTVTIRVIDATTGDPIPGASVELGVHVHTTDPHGMAAFHVMKGKYSVRVRHVRYEPVETTVIVPGTYTVRMEPIPPPPPETGNVWGILTDYRGVPAGGVKIMLNEMVDITEDDGRYEFRDVPAGTRTYKYSYGPYDYTDTVKIIAGETVRKDLAIYPIYPP